MRFFKLFVQFYLPLAITIFMLVTAERKVETDGGYNEFYSFPYKYISGSYAYSMH